MASNDGALEEFAYFLTLVHVGVDSELKPEYVFDILMQMLVDMELGLPLVDNAALDIGEAIAATKALPDKSRRH